MPLLVVAGCPGGAGDCPEGFEVVAGECRRICPDGGCLGACGDLECLPGFAVDEETCTCAPIDCDEDCALRPKPFNVASVVGRSVPLPGGGTACRCDPVRCNDGFELVGVECWPTCDPGSCRIEGLCVPNCEGLSCCDAPSVPACIRQSCEICSIARDGTDLVAAGLCIEEEVVNLCADCHYGIEEAHPRLDGIPCVSCHGGDPTAPERERAHVSIPTEWQIGGIAFGRPNIRYYFNWLTLAGVERFDGGLEWLRFRDPGDLRIADRSCGQAGCHPEKVENVRRSIMATAAGVIDGARAAAGLPRAHVRGASGIYKLDATMGMTGGGVLEAVRTSTRPGDVDRIEPFGPPDRSGAPYDHAAAIEEVYAKACTSCHLYGAGRNDRFGDFRGSGCSACHMNYAYDGQSASDDYQIRHLEPTFPQAYERIAGFDPETLDETSWLGPERPHPRKHRMSRELSSERCGTCHSGSGGIEWQYRGYQIDPNRTATAAVGRFRVSFTREIDNTFEPAARLRGLAQNQILDAVDWDGDGEDDIPADVHEVAGMECVDCHTSAELHNEIRRAKVPVVTDGSSPAQVEDRRGALISRMDAATEVRCEHCHGTLDARAVPHSADQRNPVKNLFVCREPGESIPGYTEPQDCQLLGPGRWVRSKSEAAFVLYASQVKDTVDPGTPARRRGRSVYALEASIAHGRKNGDFRDGVGPCVDGDPERCFVDQVGASGEVADGFTHLESVECYACHATWQNACFGCHVTLDDRAPAFSFATGERTMGAVTELGVTFVSPLDGQLGMGPAGKIAPFTSAGGMNLRHIEADGNDAFGRRVIVANDPSIRYDAYRHRTGYGLRPFDREPAGLHPATDGPGFTQLTEMEANAARAFNPIVPHSIQRSGKRMDCDRCHSTGGSVTAAVRYGADPAGFVLSPYLSALDGHTILRGGSGAPLVVDASRGYRFSGDSIDAQLDWAAGPEGFPYGYSNHLLMVPLPDDRALLHPLNAPTVGPVAGPLLDRLTTTIVVRPRGL